MPPTDQNTITPASSVPPASNPGGDVASTNISAAPSTADNLAAQIPPSYASPPPVANPTASSGPPSALQAALDAQLATPEPDPLAGFTAPQATVPAVAPLPPPAVDPMGLGGVDATAAIPSPPPIPAPVATETVDTPMAAPASPPPSTLPIASGPLPPNPLEVDDLAVPPPILAPAPPEPAPPLAMESVPSTPPAIGGFADPQTPVASDPNQIMDPRLQSMLAEPTDPYANEYPPEALSAMPSTAAPVDPTAELYNEAEMLAASASNPSPKKGLLVGVGVGVGVLLLGIIILALVLGRKTTTVLNVDNLSDTGTSQDSTSSTNPDSAGATPVVAPAGYTTISKLCYSFALPTDNSVAKDTSCKIDATFGKQATSTITVIPSVDSFKTLDEAVTGVKTVYNLTSPVDRKISLGGLDAVEITYTTPGSSGQKSVKIVVLTPTKNYKQGSDKVTGFEINLPNSDSTTQAAVSTLESTWTWK